MQQLTGNLVEDYLQFIDALAVENHNHTLEHYDQDCAITGTPTSQTGIRMILYQFQVSEFNILCSGRRVFPLTSFRR